jgi:hypothetical protein
MIDQITGKTDPSKRLRISDDFSGPENSNSAEFLGFGLEGLVTKIKYVAGTYQMQRTVYPPQLSRWTSSSS